MGKQTVLSRIETITLTQKAAARLKTRSKQNRNGDIKYRVSKFSGETRLGAFEEQKLHASPQINSPRDLRANKRGERFAAATAGLISFLSSGGI